MAKSLVSNILGWMIFSSVCFATLSVEAQTKPQPPRASSSMAASPAGTKPSNQFSLMGGVSLDSGQDPNGEAYKHTSWKSPVARLAYHHAFFAQRTFQMLVGGQFIYSESISEASGSSNGRQAEFSTTRSDIAASIGLGFAPARGPFMFQGLLSLGSNLKTKRVLKSTSFTTEIDDSWSDRAFPLILVIDALASYDLDENWRVIGGFNLVTDSTSSFLVGAAYAF